jgi:hypothetical protein
MSAMLAAAVLASLVAARAPAPPPPSRTEVNAAAPKRTTPGPRARLVAAARRQLGQRFRGDCSAFVRHVYAEARVPLRLAPRARSGTEAIVRPLERAKRPRPGDVAWFHRTHDRERPGKGRNLYTHIGVVERVRGARVTLIHRSNAGVERLELHLGRPADPELNDALRRRKRGDPPGQRYLAGQLIAGFATPFPAKATAVAARTPAKLAKPPAARRR